ncbi:MAG TPA: Glu-tRNA(Gln) amidotransferase GatDE subunit D, partial [Acidobacteria bacterium]|nr:Glu-tRNA(Gln) amidotransferase GatDE subunit D [Acidobacteriota bacterium]
MSSSPDPLKGYRGPARACLESFGVRVWSDVRLVNDAGSVFEGVILPRSETFDDAHISLKLKNGYNVGVCFERVAAMEELG